MSNDRTLSSNPSNLVVIRADQRILYLTPSEHRVFLGVIGGQCRKEIASSLGLTMTTIRTYITTLLRKAGCQTRYELMVAHYTGKLVLNDYAESVPAVETPRAPKTSSELLASARDALRQAGPVTRDLVAEWIDDYLAHAPETPVVHPDTARLDFLDSVTANANAYFGTTYGWKFEVNFNRAALTDHNLPALTVREAIDKRREIYEPHTLKAAVRCTCFEDEHSPDCDKNGCCGQCSGASSNGEGDV